MTSRRALLSAFLAAPAAVKLVPDGMRGDGSTDDLATIQAHVTMEATRPRD